MEVVMRFFAPTFALLAAVAVSNVGNTYAAQFPTPPPQVNAAAAEWQINGEPVVSGGDTYSATGERVFFDPKVMSQVGVYKGVPIYADVTVEPGSLVFVPVAGNMLRRYERRRVGELAGTEGSG